MKTLTLKGFPQNLKDRTESYPVPTSKPQPSAQRKPIASIQVQEKAFTQAKCLKPKSVNDAHRAILTNYSLDRRFFW
jgi:hypothetical protein